MRISLGKELFSMIRLRAVTLEDARLLYVLRTDPVTQNHSQSQDYFSFDSHIQWLKESMKNTKRHLVIMEANGKGVGSGRADFDGLFYELSWTVAPEQRGKGWGTVLVKKMIAIFCPSRVKIKKDNLFSIKLARKAGMKEVAEAAGVLFFEMTDRI
jgi:RimJ/RimL family protein N-acetyltransferase